MEVEEEEELAAPDAFLAPAAAVISAIASMSGSGVSSLRYISLVISRVR